MLRAHALPGSMPSWRIIHYCIRNPEMEYGFFASRARSTEMEKVKQRQSA